MSFPFPGKLVEPYSGKGGVRKTVGDILIILGSIIFAAGMDWSFVFGYIGAAMAVVGRLIYPEPVRFKGDTRSLLVLMILLFLWGIVLSIFVATRPGQGFLTVFAYFAHWTLPFLAGIWASRRLGPRILYLWLASLIILGFISLLAFSGFFDAPSYSREGMLVGRHNHIQFGALIFLGLSLVYGFFLSPGNSLKRSIVFAAAGVILLVFLMLTGSRSWWAAGAIALTGMTIHHVIKNRGRKAALVLMASGILIIIISIAAFPQVRARIRATNFSDPNLVHRRNMAIMARAIIKDNPVTGIGPGQTPYVKRYYDLMKNENLPQETGYLQKKHFHDIYLQMAAELGLPGLILFFMILLRIIRIMIRSAGVDKGGYNTGLIYGALWAWAALAIAEIFDCLLRGPTVAMDYFWVLGVCAGFGMDKNEIAERESL